MPSAKKNPEETTIHISADLNQLEAEMLSYLFMDYITENREMAKMKHAAGEVTDAELKWHLGHADWLDTIAKKLFPGWEEEMGNAR